MKITLYLIGGLGADERVFRYLDLQAPTVSITWIKPKTKEPISSYAKRVMEQIDTNLPFGILGVSFGGLIAIEIAKISKPEILILISSAEIATQLPRKYIWLGKTGALCIIPNLLIKPPKFLQNYLFGAKNRQLLHQIIKDTDPNFIRWALQTMVKWDHKAKDSATLRIHGTDDKLIPLKGQAIEIANGGHFMIVDRADEISKLVNKTLES